jgi:hypothetical protein
MQPYSNSGMCILRKSPSRPVIVIPVDFYTHSCTDRQTRERAEAIQSQENNSALIGFDGDGVCIRMKRFNHSGHDSKSILSPDLLLRCDGRMRVGRR